MSDAPERNDRTRKGISRRGFLEKSAAGAVGLSLGALAPDGATAAPRAGRAGAPTRGRGAGRPNIVVIVADQLNRQHCGYGGDDKAYTPNIDRMASEGADFRNGVSGYPMCSPHRASLYTGKYPSSTGMVINELRAMPDPDAIGHVLGDHGYRTAMVGKWHLFGKHHGTPQQFVPPGPYRLGFDGEWAGFNFNHKNYESFYFRDEFEKIDIDGFGDTEFTSLAIDHMRRSATEDDPFAVFLNLSAPHDPWTWDNSPEAFNELFRDVEFPDAPNFSEEGHARYWAPARDSAWYRDKRMPRRFQYRQGYHAQTAALDWNVGRIQKALKDLGLDENTIVLFTSDHGEMFGAHGRVAKKIFYEEAVRVPMLLRWPGGIPDGHVSDACIDTPDIMPTLLSLAGLPVPDSVEGMDLSHAARGRSGPEPDAAFMQGMGHTYQWVDGDEWRALRGKRYTYAVTRADGAEYLFDNSEDPFQMRNLVGDSGHKGELERFRDMLRERMAALNDTFESTTWYRDHWMEDRVIVRSATRELEREYRPENIPLPHLTTS